MHELAEALVEGHLRHSNIGVALSKALARNFLGRSGTSPGKVLEGVLRFTVGLDEVVVREYIRNQEKEDRRLEQLNLGSSKEPD